MCTLVCVSEICGVLEEMAYQLELFRLLHLADAKYLLPTAVYHVLYHVHISCLVLN